MFLRPDRIGNTSGKWAKRGDAALRPITSYDREKNEVLILDERSPHSQPWSATAPELQQVLFPASLRSMSSANVTAGASAGPYAELSRRRPAPETNGEPIRPGARSDGFM